MDTPMEDMVDMVMDMDMERGKLMLKLDILIMVMVDMVMDMVMVMDTMVKQYLFISFPKLVAFIGICWNLLSRNTDLYLKKIKIHSWKKKKKKKKIHFWKKKKKKKKK